MFDPDLGDLLEQVADRRPFLGSQGLTGKGLGLFRVHDLVGRLVLGEVFLRDPSHVGQPSGQGLLQGVERAGQPPLVDGQDEADCRAFLGGGVVVGLIDVVTEGVVHGLLGRGHVEGHVADVTGGDRSVDQTSAVVFPEEVPRVAGHPVPDRAEPTEDLQGGFPLGDVQPLQGDAALVSQGPQDLPAAETAQGSA